MLFRSYRIPNTVNNRTLTLFTVRLRQMKVTDASAQLLPLHKPFGVQSWTIVVEGCDDLWRMITIEQRCSVPIAVRCIENPMGMTTGGPLRG